MNKIIEDITKLTNEWYSLIGKGHHKDRDCHWSVNTKWSYGQEPVYVVEHYGYLLSDVEIVCNSYNDALIALKNRLKEVIEQEYQQNEY